MPTTFKEWLAEQAAREKSPHERAKLVEEWQKAVHELFAQIQAWLAEDDATQLLTFHRNEMQKNEVGLGPYRIPILQVRLPSRFVTFEPISRFVAGGIGRRADLGLAAAGRVDMKHAGEKCMLYRAVVPGGSKWFIVNENDYSAEELTKETFETAFQDLLS